MRSKSVQKYKRSIPRKSSKKSTTAIRSRPKLSSINNSTKNSQNSILKTQKTSQRFDNKSVTLKSSVFQRLYTKPIKRLFTNKQISNSELTSENDANKFLVKLKKDYEKLQLANKINDKNSRKFRMHKFVYEKKLKNELKYDDNSKLNHHAMPVPKGTISIMLNTKKKNTLFSYGDGKSKKMTKRTNFKIKWKTIQWLFLHKKEVVLEMLKNGKGLHLKFSQGREKVNFLYVKLFKCILEKRDFIDLLTLSGLGGDLNFCEKLFK